MSTSYTDQLHITDIADEILLQIILCLNPRERVSLGHSCKRFHTLVFEDKELLRDLDFSKDGDLTSASDIHKFFNNEIGNKHILKLNLENVNCIRPEVTLFNSIIKAVNLVDINIHGISIRDRWFLRDFLRPLPHVKRLCIDWPRGGASVVSEPCCKYLKERFARLTYLSIRLLAICDFQDFNHVLQSCQELNQLHMTVLSLGIWPSQSILGLELKNLQIITYYGPCLREVANHFVSTFSHPDEWTHFELCDPLDHNDGFHLEKNVEVCEEMLGSKCLKKLSYNYPMFASKLGGFIVSVCLLEEVMKIRQQNLPHKACCFSPANNENEDQMLRPSVLQGSRLLRLKTREAKLLLRDPRYEISYLGIFHNIEQECDVHLVTLTFPSLNELVLSNITKTKQRTSKKTILQSHRGANKSSDALPAELDGQSNLESSFSKLVEGTPRVRHLTVSGDTSEFKNYEIWDLAALHSIADWKNLTTLRLRNIPIVDGKFLIEIGKKCKHLENIELYHLGSSHKCCYENELLRMLIHCSNLRDLTLRQDNIRQLSELFFLLASNPQLRRVCIETDRPKRSANDLRPSVEHLLKHCLRLTKFMCLINGMPEAESTQLTSTLERLKSKLNRRTFQFQVVSRMDERNSTAHSFAHLFV